MSTRRPRFRRWTAPDRCCPCALAKWNGAPTITFAPVQLSARPAKVVHCLCAVYKQPEALVERCHPQIEHLLSREGRAEEHRQLRRALQRVETHQDRVTEAYIAEAMELDRYKTEMDKLKLTRQELERAASELAKRTGRQEDTRNALQYLDGFCRRVADGLDALSYEERQQVLRLLVERVTVVDGTVRVGAIVPTGDDNDSSRTLRGEPVEQQGAVFETALPPALSYTAQIRSRATMWALRTDDVRV